MGPRRAEIAIGTRLGRYEFKARLAIGGMAEVWLAEASGISGFKKTVVLKTILPQYADDPNFVRMFTNEALLASGLNHANIVQIFDLGEIEGIYFIAMEFIAGLTLRQVQRALAKEKTGAPPWLVLHVVMSVCDALDYAHNFSEGGHHLSMVHRDVTPENVMISFSGVTKVLDFGIAKARSAGHFTQAGTLKGKFAYMSPERIASSTEESQTDRRGDIYSIGVMLYELLAGRLPFQEENELLLLRRILDQEPPPPRAAAAWMPEALEKIIQKAMAKDVARRYQTSAELREDLSRFLVEQKATTTTERHVSRYLSTLFSDQKGEAATPTQVRKSKLSEVPLALSGFDPVQSLESAMKSQVSPVAALAHVPGGPPAREDTLTRALQSQVDEQVQRVLVVDADRVTRRFVELALMRDGFEVESAKTVSAALEILQSDPVDVIISDSDLPDMTGLQFHRRLSQETRYRDIPVVFLSADTRAATKAVALRNGVEEYLAKPCDATELSARVKALIARQRRKREALRQRHQVLAGDLSVLGFPVLVGMLEMGRRTGTLTINTDRALGAVTFGQGRITHASFGSLVGEPAVYRILAEPGGRFEFSPGTDQATAATQVSASVTTLLTIGVKLVEASRQAQAEVKVPEAEGAQGARQVKLLAGPAPTFALATQFELGVRDGFSMGELRMCGSEEMAAWTALPGGRDRFHVHLLADLADGLSALLPLSSPPTEREILAGVAPGEKMVGLDFFLRDERLLDVVLVDIRRPLEVARWLKRRPSLLILAPPDTAALDALDFELDTLLEWMAPSAVLGIGDEVLALALKSLGQKLKSPAGVHCMPGTLKESSSDLRAVLVEGIRLWAAAAKPPPAQSKGVS